MQRKSSPESTPVNKKRAGSPKATEKQKQTIALGRVNGKSHREIAAEVGLRPQTIRVLTTRDPRTMTLIQQLREGSTRYFAKMWLKAIKSLDKDLGAKDFRERHSSRGQLLHFLTVGDPNKLQIQAPNANDDGDITLEELAILMREDNTYKAG